MKPEYLDLFTEAARSVIEQMGGVTAVAGVPAALSTSSDMGAVSGWIELTSPRLTGWMSVSFEATLINAIVEHLLGECVEGITADVQDAVGELTNIIAGRVKVGFSERGVSFAMSSPAVRVGPAVALAAPPEAPITAIPFLTGAGRFVLQLCLAE